MKITALVEALVAANATPEMILAAVRTVEAQNSDALEQSREKARARFKKWKAKQPANVSQRLPTDSNALVTGDARVEDKPLNQKIEPQEESKKVARGTRLPSDFQLPDEWQQWALQRGLPAHRIPIEFEKLCNWAANAPASKAAKSNWFRAWQNWVIGAIDALPQNRARGSPVQTAPQLADVFAFVGRKLDERSTQESDGPRALIPHLSRAGQG